MNIKELLAAGIIMGDIGLNGNVLIVKKIGKQINHMYLNKELKESFLMPRKLRKIINIQEKIKI